MRTALVTGASSGIGHATARLLAAAGWRVLVVARRAERLEALARETNDDCHPVVIDLTEPGAAGVLATAIDHHAGGRLDALVNNAGAFGIAPPEQQEAAHIDAMFALNVRAVMLTTRACLPALTAAKGTIVNISSVAATETFSGCGVYSATKAAIEAWSRILRQELRERGVRVSVVAPGGTATEAFPGDLDIDPNRLCRSEDIALAIRNVIEQPPAVCVDRMVIAPSAGPL